MEVGSPSTPSSLSDVYEDSRGDPYSEREMAERRQSQSSSRISDLVSEINSEINFPPLEEFIGSKLSKLRFVEETPMEPVEETDLFPYTPLTEPELSRTDKILVEDNIREDVTSKELIDAVIDFDNKKVSNLLNRMDVSALNEWRERMPLNTACGEKNNGALAVLLAKAGIDVNAKDTINEYTPLHKACWNDNDQAVSKLLAIPGIDINVENKAGYTPLHLACYQDSGRAIARLLDVPGILVNVQAKYKTGAAYETGATPLHLACWRDNDEAIARLLDVPSIDVNAKDKAGTTPLHIACLSNKYKAVIRLLATPGIDVNVKADDDGSTPFMKAAGFDKKEAFMLLLHDDRVHLDVKNNAGRGLEEMVNRSGRRVVDQYYLDLIREERVKRENACKKKDEESWHIIIEKIKKINQKSRDNEQKWTKVLEKQEMERKKLAGKHQAEKMKKEWEREKHQEEKTRQKLEKEKLEKKHEEEKTKQERAFEAEAEGFKQNMTNLTKVKNDLAQNLEKIHFN